MDREQARARREVGKYLREARRGAGISLDKMAEGLGSRGFEVSPSTLSRVENGSASLPLEALFELVRILGISASSLESLLRRKGSRVAIDLAGWNDEGLIEEGRKKALDGDTPAALDYFQAARDWVLLQEEFPQRADRLARCLLEEAEVLRAGKNYPAAYQTLSRALNMDGLTLNLELRLLIAAIRNARDGGDRYQARLLSTHAGREAEKADPGTRGMVLAALGSFKLQDGDSVAAAAQLRTAARLFRTQGMKAEAAEAEITLGFCLHVSGASEGLPTMEKGIRRAWRGGAPGVEIEGWLHLARIWARQGEHDRAEEAYRRVRRLARRLRSNRLEYEAWAGLAEIARKKGRTSEVIRAQEMMKKVSPGGPPSPRPLFGVSESGPEESPCPSPRPPGM